MKWKYSLAAAILSISISLCGCSRVNNDSQNESETLSEPKISQESSENISSVFSSERSAASESDSAQENPTQSKILIAYFTWAENVENNSDVDATTSASVSLPGNVGQMAAWIRDEIGGDLYSIQVSGVSGIRRDRRRERFLFLESKKGKCDEDGCRQRKVLFSCCERSF